MAPKSAAAKAKADAQAATKAAEKESKKVEAAERAAEKQRKDEEDAALEATKQKNALCNFVTQAKAAEPGTKLAETYEYYKSLPLKSDQKMQIALNWKNDRSCTWLNSYTDNHKTTKVVQTSESSGWKTSYWIAKELGMVHDSPVFEAVLKGYKKGEVGDWSETDPAVRPFRDAGLPPYFFCDKSLDKSTSQESNEVVLSSMSVAKKAKLSLADIVNDSSSSSKDPKILIQFEHWHACNAHVRSIENALQIYTNKIAELKNLQVAYQKYLTTDSLNSELQGAAEERAGFMTQALQQISSMEIRSLAILGDFVAFDKSDAEGLQKYHGVLVDHLQEGSSLLDAVVQRIRKNSAWLEAQ